MKEDKVNANSNLKEDEHLSKRDKKEQISKVLALKDEEIANLKKELEKYKNQYYEAYADMQNLRKSIEKDHREAIKYRLEGFVNELLTVLDAFHVALSNEAPSEETKNYLVGFRYIYSNLISVLNNEGVNEITPKVGDKFDSNVMHAIETIETDNPDDDRVEKVLAKGYKLHDHLVRPAMVSVSKYVDKSNQETNQDNKEE